MKMKQDNPFVKDFSQLLVNIEQDLKENSEITSFYIADDSANSVFHKLLVQPLERTIKSKKVKFLSIRVVELKEEFKSKGAFSNFVKNLESLNVPIIYHDIVNEKLIPFFQKRGYQLLNEEKNGERLISMYKLVTPS